MLISSGYTTIVESYGAVSEIFGFLTPNEVTQMQSLNTWMYQKAVSRSQMKIQFRKICYLFPRGTQLTEVTKFSDSTFEIKDYELEGLKHGDDYRFVHAGLNCYLIGGERDGETRCAVFCKNNAKQVYDLMELAPTLFLRFRHAACSTPDASRIIVTGSGGSENRKKCEIYSILRNKWQQLPDLNYGR